MRSCWGIACIIAMIRLGEVTPMSAGETAFDGYRHGLNERDIVVIFVIEDAVSTKGRPAGPVSAVDLREVYGALPHEFRVVLVGKDGGVKLRQEEPISAADLFALIDSMPMRKQEMRQRSERVR